MNKVIIINPGSTATKYAFYEGSEKKDDQTLDNYDGNLEDFINSLKEGGFISDENEIMAVGMRVVHGADKFTETTVMDDEKIREFESLLEIAPLHNPPAYMQMRAYAEVLPSAKLVAVFDTSFHKDLPQEAYTYALNDELVSKYNLRRYGFHGIACQSVLNQIETEIGETPKKMIICHLGGGCSITAVENGKSIETSMGFTPLEGLMMITRSGDVDFGLLKYLADKENLGVDELEEILNKKSGFVGFCGDGNVAEIIEKAKSGDSKCRLALDVFEHRIVKYIGAYTALLGGVDCITFSGGIGEGGWLVRQEIMERLNGFLDFDFDSEKNEGLKPDKAEILTKSGVKIFAVPASEDGVILGETLKFV